MRACAGHLKITPNDFWTLTIVELAMLLGEQGAMSRFSRDTLNKLQDAYPDRKHMDERQG